MRLSLLMPLILAASPALADTLPLARGTYVQRDEECRDAPRAAIRDYDGQGIGSAQTKQCHARVLARFGGRYTLRQNCARHHGPRPYRSSENLKLRIDSHTAFTDLKNGTQYRRCRGLPR